MNILKYVSIFIYIVIFIYLCKIKEGYKQFKEYSSIRAVPIKQLIGQGWERPRSKAFLKAIKKVIFEKIPPNSVDPGQKCISKLHRICKGKSICYDQGKYHPICTAGVDGIHSVGFLKNLNIYGNYDNGSTHYFPRNTEGCSGKNLKCPPRFKCDLRYDACVEKEPIKMRTLNIPKVTSSRIQFKPPLPLKKTYKCPEEHTYFEKKYAPFCKHNETDNICALEPNKRDNHVFCSTVQCPNNFSQIEPGICENEDGEYCSLEPDEDLPLCGGRNDFLKIENTDIKNYTYDSKNNVTEKECASYCLQNPNCIGFTYDDDNKCFLKNTFNNNKDIQENNKYNLFLRTPINYSYHDKTTITSKSIKKFDNKSYIDCSKECDKDPNCNGFVVGTKNKFPICELKSSIESSKFNENKSVFKKKIIGGKLCSKLDTVKIKNEIKDELDDLEEKNTIEITKKLIELKKQAKLKINNKQHIAETKLLNKIIDDNHVIILDNIGIECNRVVIEKLDKLYLHIGILQIWGKDNDDKLQDLIQNKNTQIKMSSVFDNKISKYLKDNDVYTYASTNYDNKTNQYIEIILPKNITVHKIIIFNKIGKNKEKLFPFKINLYENDYLEHFYIKKSADEPFFQNKYIKLDRNLNVSNKGDLDKFNTIANIEGVGNTNYCRFLKTEDNNNSEDDIVCSSNTDEFKYVFKNMNTPYKDTYFTYKNSKTSKDDICRCEGLPSTSKIVCRNTHINKDYTLTPYKNCNELTGQQILKNLDKKDSCSRNYKIDAGFYSDKTRCYYLFKNSILNNVNVILYTLVDGDTYKIKKGYPKIINNNTWKGFSFKKIDSAFVIDNFIIFTKDEFYTKVKLGTYEQLAGYPKKISSYFFRIPEIFRKKITAGINIGNNIGLLFNGMQFVEYDLNMIENTSDNLSRTSNIINFDITKRFENIRINNWDAIVSKYDQNILLFTNDSYYIYDVQNKKLLTKTSMRNQWKNIWNINVNNL